LTAWVQGKGGVAELRIGAGPPLLVFHGGPGFDHSPLVGALAELSQTHTLVFFDQLGCGTTPAPPEGVSAEATFAHAAKVIGGIDEPFGIVAHSWGTIVAAAAMSRNPDAVATRTILINPVPLEGAAYGAMRAALLERIPPRIMLEAQHRIMSGEDGADVYPLLAPYYVASPDTVLPRMPMTAMTFVSVDATLDESADYRDAISRLGRLSIIRGAEDLTRPALIESLLAAAADDIVLPGVGHYPFFEDRAAFDDALRRVAD